MLIPDKRSQVISADVHEVTQSSGVKIDTIISDRRGAVTARGVDSSGEPVVIKAVRRAGETPNKEELIAKASLNNEIAAHQNLPFLREYLTHSHGETQNYRWLVSRLLSGPSSGESVRSITGAHPLAAERRTALLKIFLGMAEAVQEVHTAGYVHGDLQACHFILEPDGSPVRLIDFGSSKKVGTSSAVPEGGMIYFTAPEVVLKQLNVGAAPVLDHSSEVFSLGAVLAFLYTRDTLIDRGDGERSHESLQRDMAEGKFQGLQPIDELNYDRLSELLVRMVEVDRSKRPMMGEVVIELRQLLAQ